MVSQDRKFDREVARLRQLIFDMSDLVEEQFANALTAVLNRDLDLADEVIERDNEVDALEMEIDRLCERILALYQPVATDLRMVIIAVKINTDLERMGDHSKNFAHNAKHVVDAPEVLQATRIREMADLSRSMMRDMHTAFVNRDRVLARKVLAQDMQVNRLHRENFNSLVEYAEKNPDQVRSVSRLITASKALERLSDHTKNIAESVVFLIEGVDIRHRDLQEVEDSAAQPETKQ